MGRRVNLTLPPEIDQVLTRLADAAGTGKASFVREWLIGMAPELLKMAEALEAVRAGQVDSLSMLSEGLRGAVLKGQQAELELSHFRAAPRLRK
jgi:predicted DNA-binding protein